MNNIKKAILIILALQAVFNLKAQSPIDLSKITNPELIGLKCQYFVDSSNSMRVEQVAQNNQFTQSTKQVLNFNLTKSTIWMRFAIAPKLNNKKYCLEINNPLLDSAYLFWQDSNKVFNSIQYGDGFPFMKRKYNYASFIYDLQDSKSTPNVYYLQLNNHEQCQIALKIGESNFLFNRAIIEKIWFFCFCTILLVMFLYNMFIYLTVKDKNYLLYSVYIFCIGFAQASIHGFGFQYLWYENQWLQQHCVFIFSALTGLVSILFCIKFIEEKNISKTLMRCFKITLIGYFFTIILSLLNVYALSYFLLQILAILGVLTSLFTAIQASRNKVPSANYFLIAWSVFILGIILFVLKDYNLLPFNDVTVYTLPAGCALEVILLSFALANRIKLLQQDKNTANIKLLETLADKNEIVSMQNKRLDEEVKLQTAELNKALEDLKKQEVELINREKMSSLGVLTAGIAHEINNPINFVTGSIRPLKNDVNDLFNILALYENLDMKTLQKKDVMEIDALKKQIDLPYVKEEIKDLLNGIEEGAFRTADIVRGLQSFSRADGNSFRNADIVNGINNTLTLLNSQIKDIIQLTLVLKPLPQYFCAIGSLNQVFLNVINNAIFAVMEANKPIKKITVAAEHLDNAIIVSVNDNGNGISKENLDKIFDPFFTTKDVGKGTGLGLSITQGIIEKHKGTIRYESIVMEGTTCVITLPILQEKTSIASPIETAN